MKNTEWWKNELGRARRSFLSKLMLNAWQLESRTPGQFGQHLKRSWEHMKKKPYNFNQTVLWVNTNL